MPAPIRECQIGPTELAGLCRLDPPAERLDHRLHPVTDAQQRNPQIEQLRRKRRCIDLIDGGRPTGKHQPLGSPLLDHLERGCRRQQLGKHPALADPPGDQLRVLPSEIKDQHLLQGMGRTGRTLPRGCGSDGCLTHVSAGGWRGFGGPSEDAAQPRPQDGGTKSATGPAGPTRGPQSSDTATPADTAARPFEPIPTCCSFCSFLPSLIRAGATITSARWKERMSS